DFGHAIAVEPRLLLQPREEARHAVRIVAGRRYRADADAIGLDFVRARVIDRALIHRRLAERERSDDQVRIRRARDDRREDRGPGRDVARFAFLLRARDVTLRDVRLFVAEHAGELAFVARRGDEAGIDAHEAAGQRER